MRPQAHRARCYSARLHEVRQRDPFEAPDTPEARVIEDMKAAGLLEVRPEDVGKPWDDQRLQKTPLGEAHEAAMRERHPEWFRGDA